MHIQGYMPTVCGNYMTGVQCDWGQTVINHRLLLVISNLCGQNTCGESIKSRGIHYASAAGNGG
jgi:hypothetical protein